MHTRLLHVSLVIGLGFYIVCCRGLQRLALCYRDTISSECSDAAATAMQRLISTAFNDSFYLRLPYVPDCTLHTMTSYETKLAPPTVRPAATAAPRDSAGANNRRAGGVLTSNSAAKSSTSAAGSGGASHCSYVLTSTASLQQYATILTLSSIVIWHNRVT